MGVLSESRMLSAEAAEFAGVCLSTLLRWHRVGVDGTRLEGAYVGKKFVTSREAVMRFVEKLNAGRTSAV